MTPDGLPPLREVIRRHELSALKGLSQNFILDLNLTRKIARAAGPLDGVAAIEVGPGPGGLTRALLLEGAAQVIAVERDERCRPALEEIAAHYPGRFTAIYADALQFDLAALAPFSGPARIVSNLPYSIATPLLTRWLTPRAWPPRYDAMALMLQREVADRIVAPPGSKSYGRLSVLCQWRCRVRIALQAPPQVFTPPPKVSSAVVVFTPVADPLPAGAAAALEKVTAAAFGQRRKMLRSSLKSLFADVEGALAACSIRPQLRAEDLSIEEFCRLAAFHAASGSP